MKITIKGIFAVSALTLGLTFASCSKDESQKSVQDAMGTYTGKITLNSEVPTPVEATPTISVDAVVDADSIEIQTRPMTPLKAGGISDVIVGLMSNINYKMAYVPTLSADKDSISMKLKADPLVIYNKAEGAETTDTIKVNFAVITDGAYVYEGDVFRFELQAKEVYMNNVLVPNFNAIDLSFLLSK